MVVDEVPGEPLADNTLTPPAELGMPELVEALAPNVLSLCDLLITERDEERAR
ncbi:hypothetical protein GCM10029976_049600 [Kribbella albertanoniae]